MASGAGLSDFPCCAPYIVADRVGNWDETTRPEPVFRKRTRRLGQAGNYANLQLPVKGRASHAIYMTTAPLVELASAVILIHAKNQTIPHAKNDVMMNELVMPSNLKGHDFFVTSSHLSFPSR